MYDLISSHLDPALNTKFLKFLNTKYGEHAEVKVTRGNKHEYLGMTLIFKDGTLIVDMVDYIKNMLEEFPIKFRENESVANPATSDMFDSPEDKYLDNGQW